MMFHDYISMFDEIVFSPGFNKQVQKYVVYTALQFCAVDSLVYI